MVKWYWLLVVGAVVYWVSRQSSGTSLLPGQTMGLPAGPTVSPYIAIGNGPPQGPVIQFDKL